MHRAPPDQVTSEDELIALLDRAAPAPVAAAEAIVQRNDPELLQRARKELVRLVHEVGDPAFLVGTRRAVTRRAEDDGLHPTPEQIDELALHAQTERLVGLYDALRAVGGAEALAITIEHAADETAPTTRRMQAWTAARTIASRDPGLAPDVEARLVQIGAELSQAVEEPDGAILSLAMTTIADLLAPLAACKKQHAKGLVGDRHLTALVWTAPDGRVLFVEYETAETDPLAECVRGVLASARFPALPVDEVIILRFPMVVELGR